MRDQATINRIYSWAEKNYQKNFDNYQQNGTPSSLRTAERYEDIMDICRAAEIGVQDEDVTRKHIRKNLNAIIEQFEDVQKCAPGQKFTCDEVKKWLNKMRGCC